MNSIFEYTNYRIFLKEYYESRKAESGYTYREFANATGMNSTSWLLHLIKGTKNLTSDTAVRIAKAIKLNKSETAYFEMMVPFTQASTSDLKDHYYQKMLGLKRTLNIVKITEEQYEYYTRWYHPVIRSLVCKMDFGENFEKLGACLLPTISASEAKQSVKLLEKLGMITRGKSGRHSLKATVISTGDEINSLNVVNYHKQVSRLGENIHERAPKETRDISALTLGIGEAEFHIIKTRIQEFRKEIMDLANASVSADRIYQFNFQFFPVARATK